MLLLKNAKVLTMAGSDLERGDVLVDGGKIAAVGVNLSTPEGVQVIDCTGNTLMPGIIDAHCAIGLSEDGTMYEGEDSNEFVNPVTPQLRALDGINPMDIPFREARESGVTTVCVSPGSTNVLGGMMTILKTQGHRVDDMILKADAGVKASFGEDPKANYSARKEMPMTRMAIAGLLRKALYEAQDYQTKKGAGRLEEVDLQKENMIRVLSGELPLVANVNRMDDIYTALRIAKEFGLNLIITQAAEAYLMADELKEAGVPVIMGPLLAGRTKVESARMSHEAAAIMDKAGVSFCLSTNAPELPIQFQVVNAGCAVRAGLNAHRALEAITIDAARILGIDSRVGSIEVGKDADLVVYEQKPLDLRTRVRLVVMDGAVVYTNPACK